MKGDKLTAKQAAFVREYVIDWNATQAAIRAGYSEKTAAVIGAENLIKPNIQKAIAAKQEKRELSAIRSAEQILKDVQAVKDNAMLVTEGNLMSNHAAALKALELEGKYSAMWTDKQAVDHTTAGQPLPTPSTTAPDQLREIVKQVMDEY